MSWNYFIIPLLTVLTGAAGSFFTSRNMDWYDNLKLPSFTPPGSVIGTVWTVLFILAMTSALIVWNAVPHRGNFKLIIAVFCINALLNIGWSALFFGAHQIGAAIGEAALLGISVIALIALIWPLSRLGAALLIPYAAWVAFATYLTYAVWNLNH